MNKDEMFGSNFESCNYFRSNFYMLYDMISLFNFGIKSVVHVVIKYDKLKPNEKIGK